MKGRGVKDERQEREKERCCVKSPGFAGGEANKGESQCGYGTITR